MRTAKLANTKQREVESMDAFVNRLMVLARDGYEGGGLGAHAPPINSRRRRGRGNNFPKFWQFRPLNHFRHIRHWSWQRMAILPTSLPLIIRKSRFYKVLHRVWRTHIKGKESWKKMWIWKPLWNRLKCQNAQKQTRFL